MSPSDGINPDATAVDRRRERRRSGFWSAQLETTTGRRLDCIVLDISDRGAKLRIKHAVLPGDVMILSGKRFEPRGARVSWIAEQRAGLAFLSPPGETRGRSDAGFLRGRAAILRRMAQLADSGDTGARLMRLAAALDNKAEKIEQRQIHPPLSIRRNRRLAPVDQ